MCTTIAAGPGRRLPIPNLRHHLNILQPNHPQINLLHPILPRSHLPIKVRDPITNQEDRHLPVKCRVLPRTGPEEMPAPVPGVERAAPVAAAEDGAVEAAEDLVVEVEVVSAAGADNSFRLFNC